MKRNSLFTKLLAMMLCVMMVIGCLPLSALAEDDWESEIDQADPVPGSEEDPFEATLGDNTAAEDAADYNWVYTAEYTGVLVITSAADITVNGTAYELAEDATEVIVELDVTAEDEVKIYSESFNLSYEAGSCEAYPIWLYELENTVTNAGSLYYAGYFSGTTMTVTGDGDFSVIYNGETIAAADGVVSTAVSSSNPRMPVVFQIVGDGEYAVNFAYPEGSQMNPAIAYLGENACSIAAGGTEYYWNYTADYTGNLVVEVSSSDGNWQYTINNMTTYVYGDTQWSDSDPVVNPATIAVAEGDLIEIKVITYNPESMWDIPAGDITVNLSYEAGSCEAYPIWLYEMENTVTNAGSLYYAGYFSGTTMTVTGDGDFSVIYNGETIAAADGVVSTAVSSSNPRMPVVFQIVGDGEYAVNFVYPAGSQMNPDTAVLGDNVASIAAGGTEYYWNYTAEKAGDLVITISSTDGNWQYTVNNMTTYVYGDTQWSDSDPVVNPTTITVAEGDLIEIKVITYNPESMWDIPAGDITTNLAYTEEEVVLPSGNAELKFRTILVALQSDLTVKFGIAPEVFDEYDNVYVKYYLGDDEDGAVTVNEWSWNSAGTRCMYAFNGIAPYLAGETIHAVLYGTYEGVEYSVEREYSIVDYCVSQLEKTTSSTLQTLLVDLLNYCTAQQLYGTQFGVEYDTLINSVLTEEWAAYATTTVPAVDDIQNTKYATIDNPTGKFTGIGLTMESAVLIRYKVVLPAGITEPIVKISCELGEWEYGIDEMKYDSENTYLVYFDKVPASRMDMPVYASVYDGDTLISNTLQYSINTYGARNYKGDGTLTDNMILALMRYGASAKAYFASL